MTRPPSPAGERTEPTCPAAFHDRFGERTVVVDADTGDVIEHLQVAPVLAAQERAIRERVERLVNFRHVRFPRLRGVESSGSGSDRRVVVAADHVPGHRLSALLAFVDRHPTLSVDVNAALQVVREVLPALAVLHDSRGVTHGTVGLERMVLTAQGRVVLVDYVLGLAVERLQYPRSRLWKDFRLAMPPTAGVPRLDQRADVAQVALALLALLLGRPVAFGEFPEGLRPLLQSAVERLPDGTVRPLSAPLRAWLERALPLESRKPFTTALDAQVAFEDLIKKARGYSPSAASLKAFLQRYENCLAKESAPAEAKAQETPARGAAGRAKAPTPAPAQGEARRPAAGVPPAARRPAARRLSPEEEAAEEIRSLEAELARLAGAGEQQPGAGETSSPPEPPIDPAGKPAIGMTLAAAARAPAAGGVESRTASSPAQRAGLAGQTPRHPDDLPAGAGAGAGVEASTTARAEPGVAEVDQQPVLSAATDASGPAGETGAAAARHRASPRAARTRAAADAARSVETPGAGPQQASSPPPATVPLAASAAAEPHRTGSADLDPATARRVLKDAAADPHRMVSGDRARLSEAARLPDDGISAPRAAPDTAAEPGPPAGETAATAPTLDGADLGEPETEVLVLGQPLPAIEIVSMPDGTETRLVVTDDRTPALAGAAEAAAAPAAQEEDEDEVAYLERMLRELAASEAAEASPSVASTSPAPLSRDDASPAESGAPSQAQPPSAAEPAASAADVPSGAATGREPALAPQLAPGAAASSLASESAAMAAAGTTETEEATAAASGEASLVEATAGTPETGRTGADEEAGWRLEPPRAEEAAAIASPFDGVGEEQPAVVDEWSLSLDFEKEPEPVALVPAREPFHRRLRRRHGRPRVSRADVTRLQMLTAIHGRDDGSRPEARSGRPKGTPGAPRASRRAPAGRPAPRALPADATPVPAAVVLKPATGMAHIVARAMAASGAPGVDPLVLVPPGPGARLTRAATSAALPERCDQKPAPLARVPEPGLVAASGAGALEAAAVPAVVRLVPGLAVDALLRELRGPDAGVEPGAAEAAEPGERPPSVSESLLPAEVRQEEVDAAATAVASLSPGVSGLAAEAGVRPLEPIALPRLEDLAPAELTPAAGDVADAAVLQVEPSAEDELRRLLAALSAEASMEDEAGGSTAPAAMPAPQADDTSLAAWTLDDGEPFDVGGPAECGDASGWLARALLELQPGEEPAGEPMPAGAAAVAAPPALGEAAAASTSAGEMVRAEAVRADAAAGSASASDLAPPVETGSEGEAAAAALAGPSDAAETPASEPPPVPAAPEVVPDESRSLEPAPVPGAAAGLEVVAVDAEPERPEHAPVPGAVADPEAAVLLDRDKQCEPVPAQGEAMAGTPAARPGEDAASAVAPVVAGPSVPYVEPVAPAAAEGGPQEPPTDEVDFREPMPRTMADAPDRADLEAAAAAVCDEAVRTVVARSGAAVDPAAGTGLSALEWPGVAPGAAAEDVVALAASSADATTQAASPDEAAADTRAVEGAPVIHFPPAAAPPRVGVAADAAEGVSQETGAGAPPSGQAGAWPVPAPSADKGAGQSAGTAVPPRALHLVPPAAAAPPAGELLEPAGPGLHGPAPSTAADTTAVPATQAVGAEGLPAPAERRSLRAVPTSRKEEAAEGQPPRGTRAAPRPGKKTAKRRGKRGRPAVVPPGLAPPVSSPVRPGQAGVPAIPGIRTRPAAGAAGVASAPATEPPQRGQTTTPVGASQAAARTPPPPTGDIAARSPADRPHPTEPAPARREESPPDLALMYAPWRLRAPAPADAPSREGVENDVVAADPWNRAPETARIRVAPPEIPLVSPSEQEPAAAAPDPALPAVVVPAAVPVDAAAPAGAPVAAPATAGPDAAAPEVDLERPARREPLLFESWQERAPTVPAPRRWRVDWKRTAAAALVVVLLEGVAFATAYWLVRPPENGTLLVQTSEAGVEVWIDGRPRGRTPLSVDLEPGRHTLEMRGFGAAKTMPVEISPGVQTTQFVRWRRALRTGALKVTTTPDGARILVDGRYRGVSPLVIDNLPVGRHTIVAEHTSGTVSSSVDVAADATTEADIGIFSGWLTVFAPIEVRIFLGGRFLGTSLDGKLLVPPGHHDIEVVNARLGYRETRSVDIEPGRNTAVSIEVPDGTIAIEAPDGTEVSIDGKVVGVMPLGPLAAPIGTREVVLRHPQLGQRRIAVSVGLDAPARVSLLAPQ